MAEFYFEEPEITCGTWTKLYARNFTGTEGTVQLKATATFPGNVTFDIEFAVEVINVADEDMPRAIVPQNPVKLAVGEEYTATLSELSLDGNIPDGVACNPQFWAEELEGMESFQWNDNGSSFTVSFAEAGVYHYDAGYLVGGKQVSVPVTLCVDSSLVHYPLSDFVLVADMNEGAVSFIGDFGMDLDQHKLADGEAITWTVGPVDDTQPNVAEFYFEEPEITCGTWTKLYARNFTGTEGTVQLKATATFPGDVTFDIEFAVEVVVESTPINGSMEIDLYSNTVISTGTIGEISLYDLAAEDESGFWTVQPESFENNPADLSVQNMGNGYTLYVDYINDAGTGNYTIIYESFNGGKLSRDITLTFVETTETLPNAIELENPIHYIMAGEPYTFTTEDATLSGGTVPEGVTPRFFFEVNTTYESFTVENNGDSIEVTANDEGSMNVTLVANFGGKELRTSVGIVSSIETDEAPCVETNLYNLVHYASDTVEEQDEFGTLHLRNIVEDENANIQWTVSFANEEHSAIIQDLYFVRFYSSSDREVALVFQDLAAVTEETVIDLIVTVTTDIGFEEVIPVQIKVLPMPENLPENQRTFNILNMNIGDTYTYSYNDVLDTAPLPEGMFTETNGSHTFSADQIQGTDDGFTVTFDSVGAYSAFRSVRVGSLYYSVTENIYVGFQGSTVETEITKPEVVIGEEREIVNCGQVKLNGLEIYNISSCYVQNAEIVITDDNTNPCSFWLLPEEAENSTVWSINAQEFTGETGEVTGYARLTVMPWQNQYNNNGDRGLYVWTSEPFTITLIAP